MNFNYIERYEYPIPRVTIDAAILTRSLSMQQIAEVLSDQGVIEVGCHPDGRLILGFDKRVAPKKIRLGLLIFDAIPYNEL